MATIINTFMSHKEELTKYVARHEASRERTDNKVVPFVNLDYYSAKIIGEWFQTFWEELPDNMSIHTYGFNTVCDIAEMYCFGEY